MSLWCHLFHELWHVISNVTWTLKVVPLSWWHLCHQLWVVISSVSWTLKVTSLSWYHLYKRTSINLCHELWHVISNNYVINCEGYAIIMRSSMPWTLTVTPLWCRLCHESPRLDPIAFLQCHELRRLSHYYNAICAMNSDGYSFVMMSSVLWSPRLLCDNQGHLCHLTSQGTPITVYIIRVMSSQGCPIRLTSQGSLAVLLSCTSHDFSRLPHYPVYHLTSQGSLIVLLSHTSHEFSRLPHYPVYHMTFHGSLIILLSCTPHELHGSFSPVSCCYLIYCNCIMLMLLSGCGCFVAACLSCGKQAAWTCSNGIKSINQREWVRECVCVCVRACVCVCLWSDGELSHREQLSRGWQTGPWPSRQTTNAS